MMPANQCSITITTKFEEDINKHWPTHDTTVFNQWALSLRNSLFLSVLHWSYSTLYVSISENIRLIINTSWMMISFSENSHKYITSPAIKFISLVHNYRVTRLFNTQLMYIEILSSQSAARIVLRNIWLYCSLYYIVYKFTVLSSKLINVWDETQKVASAVLSI